MFVIIDWTDQDADFSIPDKLYSPKVCYLVANCSMADMGMQPSSNITTIPNIIFTLGMLHQRLKS